MFLNIVTLLHVCTALLLPCLLHCIAAIKQLDTWFQFAILQCSRLCLTVYA